MSLIITKGFGTSGGATVPSLVDITPSLSTLTLEFDTDIVLSGDSAVASSWVIHAILTGYEPTVSSVSVVGNVVTLAFTGQHTQGEPYSLEIPTGILSVSGANFVGPYTAVYVGVGDGPTVTSISVPNINTIDVTFSESVVVSEATNAANYSVTGGLYPVSVGTASLLVGNVYRLSVSPSLASGESYTLSVSNIHDMFGNLVH